MQQTPGLSTSVFTGLVSVNTGVQLETPRCPAMAHTLPRLQLSADAKEQRAKQNVPRFLKIPSSLSLVCL